MRKDELQLISSAVRRSLVHAPGQFLRPDSGLSPKRLIDTIKFKVQTYIENPYFFKPCGTLVFCGSQGEGKTLSAVNYIQNVLDTYPMAILVTNTRIRNRPINAYIDHVIYTEEEYQSMYDAVSNDRKAQFYDSIIDELLEDFHSIVAPTVTAEDYIKTRIVSYPFNLKDDYMQFKQTKEWVVKDIFTNEPITPDKILDGTFKNVTIQYWGLDTLKYVNNGKQGVIFFVDEIHLELNSLESKNVPVEVMVEISQQRKQRKHIIGTSQRYNRMAKPLREQVRDVIACKCYFGVLQYNQLIDGDSTHEVNGELAYDVRRRIIYLHSPSMYQSYDTYVKMTRYNNEWQGRPQILNLDLSPGIGGATVE